MFLCQLDRQGLVRKRMVWKRMVWKWMVCFFVNQQGLETIFSTMVFLIPCELIELDNAISKIDVSISSTDKVLMVCFYLNRRLETEGLILNFILYSRLLYYNPINSTDPCQYNTKQAVHLVIVIV